MRLRPWIASLALAALPLGASAQTSSTPAAAPQAAKPAPAAAAPTGAAEYQRVELPGGEGKPFPYTVEIPKDWKVREIEGMPGVWLGPAGAEPPNDPRLIYVRISLASLADPEKVVTNIKSNDAKQEAWSAPLAEVREVGGVKGVLVRMDSGAGEAARSTLALKLPLDTGGVDFMASAKRDEFEKMLPTYERVLFSVRRRS